MEGFNSSRRFFGLFNAIIIRSAVTVRLREIPGIPSVRPGEVYSDVVPSRFFLWKVFSELNAELYAVCISLFEIPFGW